MYGNGLPAHLPLARVGLSVLQAVQRFGKERQAVVPWYADKEGVAQKIAVQALFHGLEALLPSLSVVPGDGSVAQSGFLHILLVESFKGFPGLFFQCGQVIQLGAQPLAS